MKPDALLSELRRRARTVLCDYEVLAGIGGEELTLILVESSLEEARDVGKR